MADPPLTDTLAETLALFEECGAPQTTPEVADRLDLGRRSTYERLERLVAHDRLATKKVGANARVWWRPRDGGTDGKPRIPPTASFVDEVGVGIFVLDADFDVAWVNETAERYFGIDRERAIGRDKRTLVRDRIAPAVADSEAFAETVLAAYDDNSDRERFECRVTADGDRSARWLEHRSRPIESGQYAGGRVELYYDVTERRESERRLERERSVVDQLLQTSPVGIALFASDGSIERVNERMATLFGTSPETVAELSPEERELTDENGDPLPFDERPVGRVFETGEAVSDRVVGLETVDGEHRWLSVSAVPFRDERDRIERVVAVVADVTQRREQAMRLERQRDELESELEEVLERISNGFYALDEGLRFTYVNERAASLLDLDESAAIGRDIRDAVAVTDRFEAALREARESQEPVVLEDYYEPLGGWFENAIYPSASGLSVYFRDVTERKERAAELERYTGLIDAVDEPVYEIDAAGQFTFVNEALVKQSGYTEAELLDGDVTLGMDDETIARVQSEIADLLAAGEEGYATLEYEVHTKAGETIPVENRISLLTDDEGRFRGSAGVLRDVSHRQEREQELERYETIVETIDDGVYTHDEDGRFVMVNDALCELSGYDREELIGAHATLLHDERVDERAAAAAADLADGDATSATLAFDLQTADGGAVPVESKFSRVAGDSGACYAGIVRDVSERVQYEETLTALYDSARELLVADSQETVTDVVLETVTDVLDLGGAVAYLSDETEDRLVPAAVSSDSRFAWDDLPTVAADDSSITGHVFATGETRLYDDVTDSPHLLRTDTTMRAGIFAPIGDFGILVVGSDRVGEFDERTRRLVDLLAANAEAAYTRVERARDLEESRRRYQTLVENFPDGAVALVDQDRRYRTVGGTLQNDASVDIEDLVGRRIDDLLEDDLAADLVPRYEAALDGESSTFERSAGGSTFLFRIVPVRDDDGEVFAAMGVSQDVTEQVERERRIERQRERLAALDDLNALVRDITEAVIAQSTREDIESIVCDRLAAADSYEFAWIGDVDVDSQLVTVRTEAGVDGYLDSVTISVDPADPRGMGPAGRAVQTQEMQVTHDALADPAFAPWAAYAEEYGFRSAAAIPIVSGDTLYGVLGVYSARAGAFGGEEGAVLSQLGEVVGHAIAAAERKRALLSDEVIELDVRIRDVFDALGVDASPPATIRVDQTVPLGDGRFLAYGETTEEGLATLRALVDAVPHWEAVTARERDGAAGFELRLVDPPVLSAVAALGGALETSAIEDGDYRMRVRFAPGTDVRAFLEEIRESYPGAELLKQRQVTRRTEADDGSPRDPTADLTDRQRAALQVAFHAGFFEWPRDASGEDVARVLDVAPPTFHQHLRKAQQKVFGSLLSDTAPA